MIVIDPSAALGALTSDSRARVHLASNQLHAAADIDTVLASALTSLVASGSLAPADAVQMLTIWQHVGVIRHVTAGLLPRIWQLSAASDPGSVAIATRSASAIALAEALDCDLVTLNRDLASHASIRCAVTVLPA